jgi:8-oxo-dGTP diphosphatase
MTASHTELIARAVVRDDDRILTVRQKGKNWSFLPGGHVEPGEPVEPALVREITEELAAKATVTRFVGVVEHGYTDDDGVVHHELNLVFEAALADADVTGQEDHLEFAWLPLAELPDHDLRPGALRDALVGGFGGSPFWRPWKR